MCLAIPGKIIKLLPNSSYGLVDFNGIESKVNLELVKVKKNDWVIVHAGFAIEKLKEQDARQTINLINKDGKNSK